MTILLQVVGAFALDAVEVSERDILWGVALDSDLRNDGRSLDDCSIANLLSSLAILQRVGKGGRASRRRPSGT